MEFSIIHVVSSYNIENMVKELVYINIYDLSVTGEFPLSEQNVCMNVWVLWYVIKQGILMWGQVYDVTVGFTY